MSACLFPTAFPLSKLPILGGGVPSPTEFVFRFQRPGQDQHPGGSLLPLHHPIVSGGGRRGDDPVWPGGRSYRGSSSTGRGPGSPPVGIAAGEEQGAFRQRQETEKALFPAGAVAGGGFLAGRFVSGQGWAGVEAALLGRDNPANGPGLPGAFPAI